MEFMLDTVNLKTIREAAWCLPLQGVTCNPSIVREEGCKDFWAHMSSVREIIGKERSLHVQLLGHTAEEMLREASAVREHIDGAIYVKIPVTEQGVAAIRMLKKEGVFVTATAIYSHFQAYMAIAAGADYIAPYYNRMENLGVNAAAAIRTIRNEIDRNAANTKILAASFKNVWQVDQAIAAGAHTVTISPQLMKAGLNLQPVQKALEDFERDWLELYEKGLSEL